MNLLCDRYLEGEWDIDRTWSHNIPEFSRLVAQDVNYSMQFFVICHEIAHGICRHQGTALTWNLTSEAGGQAESTYTEIERQWDQEREADYVGFLLGKGISHRHGIPIETYSWSCYLLLSSLAWCSPATPPQDESMHTHQQKYQRHQTHPPFQQRLSWLEGIVRREKAGVNLEPIDCLCRTITDLISRRYILSRAQGE